jgi:hypothetical protein
MLSAIPMLKLVSALWVFTLEQVFKMLQTYEPLCHMAIQRTVLKYRISVSFPLRLMPSSFFWHFKAVVDPWQL